MFTPAVQQVARADIRHKASLRMTKIAAAAAAYHAENGEYPLTIGLLAPKYLAKIPLDPFSNAAFKYKPLSKGIFIYSVYVNGTDEGGSDDMQTGDWPFYWGVEAGSEQANLLQHFQGDFAEEEEAVLEQEASDNPEDNVSGESDFESNKPPLARTGK